MATKSEMRIDIEDLNYYLNDGDGQKAPGRAETLAKIYGRYKTKSLKTKLVAEMYDMYVSFGPDKVLADYNEAIDLFGLAALVGREGDNESHTERERDFLNTIFGTNKGEEKDNTISRPRSEAEFYEIFGDSMTDGEWNKDFAEDDLAEALSVMFQLKGQTDYIEKGSKKQRLAVANAKAKFLVDVSKWVDTNADDFLRLATLDKWDLVNCLANQKVTYEVDGKKKTNSIAEILMRAKSVEEVISIEEELKEIEALNEIIFSPTEELKLDKIHGSNAGFASRLAKYSKEAEATTSAAIAALQQHLADKTSGLRYASTDEKDFVEGLVDQIARTTKYSVTLTDEDRVKLDKINTFRSDVEVTIANHNNFVAGLAAIDAKLGAGYKITDVVDAAREGKIFAKNTRLVQHIYSESKYKYGDNPEIQSQLALGNKLNAMLETLRNNTLNSSQAIVDDSTLDDRTKQARIGAILTTLDNREPHEEGTLEEEVDRLAQDINDGKVSWEIAAKEIYAKFCMVNEKVVSVINEKLEGGVTLEGKGKVVVPFGDPSKHLSTTKKRIKQLNQHLSYDSRGKNFGAAILLNLELIALGLGGAAFIALAIISKNAETTDLATSILQKGSIADAIATGGTLAGLGLLRFIPGFKKFKAANQIEYNLAKFHEEMDRVAQLQSENVALAHRIATTTNSAELSDLQEQYNKNNKQITQHMDAADQQIQWYNEFRTKTPKARVFKGRDDWESRTGEAQERYNQSAHLQSVLTGEATGVQDGDHVIEVNGELFCGTVKRVMAIHRVGGKEIVLKTLTPEEHLEAIHDDSLKPTKDTTLSVMDQMLKHVNTYKTGEVPVVVEEEHEEGKDL